MRNKCLVACVRVVHKVPTTIIKGKKQMEHFIENYRGMGVCFVHKIIVSKQFAQIFLFFLISNTIL